MTGKTTNAWKPWLGAAAFYLGVVLLVTASAWSDPTRRTLGFADPVDMEGTLWAYWWVGEALKQGISPFQATANFLPTGQSPIAFYNLLDALIATPFVHTLGPHLGYNVVLVLFFVTSALAVHWLAREAGAGHAASLVAGAGLVTSSFLLHQAGEGRLSQTLLCFWILTLGGCLRILRGSGSLGWAVGTGCLAAATALSYWFYGLFLVLAVVPLLGVYRRQLSRRVLGQLGVAVAVATLVCLPILVQLVQGFDALPGVNRKAMSWMAVPGLDRGEFGLANAIRWGHWPLWPALLEPWPWAYPTKQIALVILIPAVVAGVRRVPGWKPWVSMALFGWVLTLGPYLHLADKAPTHIPLPYLLLYDHLPFFDRFWWPHRLEILVWIPLLVLAALQLQSGIERWQKMAWIAPPLLVAGLFAESGTRNPQLPLPSKVHCTYPSRVYEGLEGGLLTTPVLPILSDTRILLRLQTHHGQPILAGDGDHLVEHRPPGYTDALQSNGITAALADLGQGSFQGATLTPEDVRGLQDMGLAYAVVEPAAYPAGLRSQWAQTYSAFFTELWGAPWRTEDQTALWRIRPLEEEKWVYVPFHAGRKRRP